MVQTLRTLFLAGLMTLGACAGDDSSVVVSEEPTKAERPNVLLIVADDLGYSDLGSFGGEIQTPNLDRLAFGGVRLTNFHVAPTCSPTRSMLLSGVDSHKAGLGNMAEEIAPNQQGQPGYEGYLNDQVVPLPKLFKDAGYRTYMTGKWHLGMTEETSPNAKGFDKAFALLQGGASHFPDMAPIYAEDPNNVPKAKYWQDGKLLEELPDNFEFSSQFYVDQLIQYLGQEQDSDKPFFAYLSYTAPHWPIQAPDSVIDKYKSNYDGGYQWLEKQRLEKQKELGLVPRSAPLSKLETDARPWDELTDAEKAMSARTMEVYAAMVDDLDHHTGRLLEYLKSQGVLDNTIIVFMSDNGAEGHDMEALWNPNEFPAAYRWIMENHDFSLEGVGRKGSYTLYGPGWGGAATPAMQGYKAFPTEGGTRSAAFVHYPKTIKPGTIAAHLAHVKDITPTLLEMAGVFFGQGSHGGRVVEPISGVSILPVLTGEVSVDAASDRVIGTELFGKRAIRYAEWKIVHMPPPHGTGSWQLYDLSKDLAENNDLAEQEPAVLQKMIALWDAYAEENNVILPDWVSGY